MQRDLRWHSVPSEVSFEGDEVHVWRACVRRLRPRAGELLRLLTPDEVTRAERFHFAEDRRRFVITRGMLRLILSRYVRIGPGELRFVYSAFGKPSLGGDNCSGELQFNLSHSHEVALYAVACGRQVGIDVEQVRPDTAVSEIAGQFFSGPEICALNALPAESRVEGFFNCWTRKEAYIKALGVGLSCPPDGFSVSLTPGEPAALLGVVNQPRESARWQLQDLPVGSGYAAALAVEGDEWGLKCWSEHG